MINDPRVESWSDERGMGDGIWIYLKRPYYNEFLECGTIHEQTVKRCLEVFNFYVTANENYWNE